MFPGVDGFGYAFPHCGVARREITVMPSVDYAVTSKYFQSSDESCWYAAYCTLFDYKQQPIGQIRECIEKAQPKLDY
jgi:hypothetical protein